jgi:hypothetical protein
MRATSFVRVLYCIGVAKLRTATQEWHAQRIGIVSKKDRQRNFKLKDSLECIRVK